MKVVRATNEDLLALGPCRGPRIRGRVNHLGSVDERQGRLERRLALRVCGERGAILMGNRPQIVWLSRETG